MREIDGDYVVALLAEAGAVTMSWMVGEFSSTQWLLYEGDTELDRLDVGEAGVCVHGDLTVGVLTDANDVDASLWVVTGDLRADRVVQRSAGIVLGDAKISDVFFADSWGDYTTFVGGALRAHCAIVSGHTLEVGGDVDVAIGHGHPLSDSARRSFDSPHQFLRPEYYELDDWGDGRDSDFLSAKIVTALSDGESILLPEVLESCEPDHANDTAGRLSLADDDIVQASEVRQELRLDERVFDWGDEIRLLRGDVLVEGDLDLDSGLDVFIDGNLTVTGNVVNESIVDGHFLAVLGDVTVSSIINNSSVVYVSGAVTAENAIYGYGEGSIKIEGDVRAEVVLSDEQFFDLKGKLDAVAAATNYYAFTRSEHEGCEQLAAILRDDVQSVAGGIDHEATVRCLRNGESLLKT